MDNKPLEQLAKNTIVNKLIELDLYVSDPYFDIKGSDLLVIKGIKSNVELGIIQCKGRYIKLNQGSNVTIHKSYVQDNFVVFIYLKKEGNRDTEFLYCYFPDDIKTWNLNSANKYVLTIPIKFENHSNFEKHKYSDTKAKKLLKIFEKTSFNINDYVSKLPSISKLLYLWRGSEDLPTIEKLYDVVISDDPKKMQIEEKILLFFTSIYREEELEYRHDEFPELTNLDYLLNDVIESENQHDKLIDLIQFSTSKILSLGSHFWYNKKVEYLLVKSSLPDNNVAVRGLHGYIYIVEDNLGVELFLPFSESYVPKIIKHTNDVLKYYNDLCSKIPDKPKL